MAEKEVFSIVVVGAMNNAIHHPYWYRDQGLIDGDEMEKALSHKETVFIPDISQFSTDELLVNCQARRWEAKTPNRAFAGRIVEIAGKLFDEILPHTPVVACGFNFIFVRNIEGDAHKVVAGVLKKCPLDFGMPIESAEIRLRCHKDENCLDSMNVTPLPESAVRFATNVNYSLEVPNAVDRGKPFALRDTLVKFATTLSEVEARTNKIADQLRSYAHD